MTLPNLPTDNLYKFVALSGVAIMVFTVFFYFSQLGEVRTVTSEIKSETNQLRLEVEFLETDMSLPDSMTFKEIRELLKDSIAAKDLHMHRQMARELDRKITAINDKMELHTERMDDFKLLTGVTIALLVIGFFMSRYGFKNWIEEIQRPLDERIQLELKILQAQKGNKKKKIKDRD